MRQTHMHGNDVVFDEVCLTRKSVSAFNATTAWQQIPIMTKLRFGVRQPRTDGTSLTFNVAGGIIKITVNVHDTYDVTFYRRVRAYKARPAYLKVVACSEQIFCDQLGEVIDSLVSRRGDDA